MVFPLPLSSSYLYSLHGVNKINSLILLELGPHAYVFSIFGLFIFAHNFFLVLAQRIP